MDESKITKEQRLVAERIERELGQDANSKKMRQLEVEEDKENEEMQFSAVVRDQESPGQGQNEQPLLEFKKTLMDKLGGSNSKKQAFEEQRSRVNSLRNGETSKVLQTHNIDVPIINKEHCDQYQEFQ